MSKHKKTLKEKIIADFNRQVYSFENKNTPLNISAPKIVVNENSQSYTYVVDDVLKTIILTAAIIAGEVILFFLLKNHVIILPKISY